MLFNSLSFVLFFALVLGAHQLPLSWPAQKRNLLAASWIFYAAWNPWFLTLLLATTIVDFFSARAMAGRADKRARLPFLVLSLIVDLGLLSTFKYGAFFLANLAALLPGWTPPKIEWIFPVGISFYTFMSLSYVIEVYRGKMRSWPSFSDYALYLAFFPQILAGPIIRPFDFLPQLETPRRASRSALGWGAALFVFGIFQKMVLADWLMAPMADQAFAAAAELAPVAAWAGTFAYSIQIYFDFAGYSYSAIGAGMCLGFILPDNFRAPYAAAGFSDFWRRWHISLSSWLRDYLYISFGGNRGGNLFIYRNLMLTMLLGGLWHGAGWRFIAWGGLHGLYLVLERIGKKFVTGPWTRTAPARAAWVTFTFVVISVTWIFFRAPDFGTAFHMIAALVGAGGETLPTHLPRMLLVAGMTAGVVLVHWWMRDSSLEQTASRLPWWALGAALAAMILAIILVPGEDNAFIYFQF